MPKLVCELNGQCGYGLWQLHCIPGEDGAYIMRNMILCMQRSWNFMFLYICIYMFIYLYIEIGKIDWLISCCAHSLTHSWTGNYNTITIPLFLWRYLTALDFCTSGWPLWQCMTCLECHWPCRKGPLLRHRVCVGVLVWLVTEVLVLSWSFTWPLSAVTWKIRHGNNLTGQVPRVPTGCRYTGMSLSDVSWTSSVFMCFIASSLQSAAPCPESLGDAGPLAVSRDTNFQRLFICQGPSYWAGDLCHKMALFLPYSEQLTSTGMRGQWQRERRD